MLNSLLDDDLVLDNNNCLGLEIPLSMVLEFFVGNHIDIGERVLTFSNLSNILDLNITECDLSLIGNVLVNGNEGSFLFILFVFLDLLQECLDLLNVGLFFIPDGVWFHLVIDYDFNHNHLLLSSVDEFHLITISVAGRR